MNYNLTNYGLNDLYTYNTLGSGSGIPALFTGVNGLSVFTDGCASSNSLYTCRNTNNSMSVGGMIGVALGGLLASIGIGVGMKALNNLGSKTRAENNRPNELQKQIDKYNSDIQSKLKTLCITESEFSNYDPHKAADVAGKQQAYDKADADFKQAEKAVADAKSKIDSADTQIGSLKGTLATATTQVDKDKIQAEIDKLEADKKTYQAEQAAAEKTKEEKDAALKKADKELQEAKKNEPILVDAYNAVKILIQKRDAAKKELDAIKLEKGLDDADGTAISRMFGKRTADIDNDGTISGNFEDFDNKDWQRILAKYRKGSSSVKNNIKESLKNANDEGKLSNAPFQDLIKSIIGEDIKTKKPEEIVTLQEEA